MLITQSRRLNVLTELYTEYLNWICFNLLYLNFPATFHGSSGYVVEPHAGCVAQGVGDGRSRHA